jgi:hypothetical protein
MTPEIKRYIDQQFFKLRKEMLNVIKKTARENIQKSQNDSERKNTGS